MKTTDELAGYRLRHVVNEHRMLQAVHNKCKGELIISEDPSKRMGLDSVIVITCDQCELEYVCQSSYQSKPGTWMPQDAMDINTRIVYALTEMGCSLKELRTFCAIMDLPISSVSPTMWNDRVTKINCAVKMRAEKVLEANRRELFSIYSVDAKNRLIIPVTFDGTWMTRGWKSHVGVGFILSVDTGKPIAFAIRINYCQQCHFCPYKKGTTKYIRWFRRHKNQCTFDKVGSKNMEADIAIELWQKSPEYNIYYKYMVCDGDSSAWNQVRFVYGACNNCKNYYQKTEKEREEFDRSADGQAYWENHRDDIDCMLVMKENCINHGAKSLTSACRKVREQNKKIGGKGSNKLTDAVIRKRGTYYRNSIIKHKVGPKATETEMKKAIEDTRREIKAVQFHGCIKNSPAAGPLYCRKEDGWC